MLLGQTQGLFLDVYQVWRIHMLSVRFVTPKMAELFYFWVNSPILIK